MKNLSGMFLFKVMAIIILKDSIESLGDLFFKMGALSTGINNVVVSNFLEFAARITSNPWLWIGIIFYLVNFFLWIALLSRVDLSVAFPMSSFTYIIVPFLAIVFLGEKVHAIRWTGIILIIIGVSLAGRSAGDDGGKAIQ
jgi:drug/metabolite transporter (DMT)-like permease